MHALVPKRARSAQPKLAMPSHRPRLSSRPGGQRIKKGGIGSPGAKLQRICACGRAGFEDRPKQHPAEAVQDRSATATSAAKGAVPPIVHDVLVTPGRPLDRDTRAVMETRFGHDFGQVRLHTGARAAASARAIDALAYTVGRHVVLAGEPGHVASSRILAHELAHVVQQQGSRDAGPPGTMSAPGDAFEREADRAAAAVTTGHGFRPALRTEPAVHRQPPPPPPAPAPSLSGLRATRDAFNNTGGQDADNCAPDPPAALGVDGPAVGLNGMELIFRISGAIPAGTEFDITRTRAAGLWQEVGGAWTRVGGEPAGTGDDHHDEDECLTPVNRRIFVVDTPGLDGTLDPTGVAFFGAGTVDAAATAAVWRLSFAEWVIARNRLLGIDWTAISRPTFHRWHSIFSVESVGGTWTRVDTPSGTPNEIELGATRTTGATP